MRLYLSNADLKGDYCASFDCPIHRALSQKFPGKTISVNPTQVTISNKTYPLVKGDAHYILGMQNILYNEVKRNHRPVIVGL